MKLISKLGKTLLVGSADATTIGFLKSRPQNLVVRSAIKKPSDSKLIECLADI